MYCDNVAVLHPKIVTDDTVDTGAAIIEIVIRQHDENSVLSLLALNKYRVATEKL